VAEPASADPAKAGPALVDTAAAITPAWLTAALRAGGLDVDVATVAHEPVGTGQMSNTSRLTVAYASGDGPATMVVKLPLQVEAARATAASSYRTEVGFYTELAASLPIDVPRCWFGAIDNGGADFVLLLEDLAPAEQGDQIAGCTVDQARAALVNLAGLHGPHWCDPALRSDDGLEFVARAAGGDGGAGMKGYMDLMTPAFVERYDPPAEDVDVLRSFTERCDAWVSGRRERFGLVHGDYRLDNLMFATAAGGRPCVAVDWQILGVGLPARDVGFFVSTALEPGARAAHEDDLLAAYHAALVAAGATDYDLDTCRDDYRFGLFQATMVTVLGAMVAPQTDRGDEMFRVMTRRSCAAIRDLDALALL
jgi:aminoglycoside/choline kinase family phosphotransferase